jgi:hypothetical protein
MWPATRLEAAWYMLFGVLMVAAGFAAIKTQWWPATVPSMGTAAVIFGALFIILGFGATCIGLFALLNRRGA